MKASIAIFKGKFKYDSELVRDIPDELFNAAIRVATNKTTEVIMSNHGFYVILYAENGPVSQYVNDGVWFPVKIYQIESWRSGGIREEEIKSFIEVKGKDGKYSVPH